MNKEIKTDISIVGAGVTGLMLTNKLTDMGYSVALIDKDHSVASGPSTKNEGWLHRGTYHAMSIKDDRQAAQVARRCIYGYDQIRQIAPEAIEDVDKPTFAVVPDMDTAERAIKRWEAVGVVYKPVTKEHFTNTNPGVNTDTIAAAFEVADMSINTRLLYHKLLTQSKKGGASIFLGTKFNPIDEENAVLQTSEDERIDLRSDLFLVTAGTGTGSLYKDITGANLPVRFWKSHLLVFPRLTENNIFSLSPGEAALFNHNKTSVVGQHEDAIVIDEPDFSVIEARQQQVFKATNRLFPRANLHEDTYMSIACIKPDIALAPNQQRSLDITVFEPTANYIFALPGKMTEAPFVVDTLVQTIFDRLGHSSDTVAFRPCDIYRRSSMLENATQQ